MRNTGLELLSRLLCLRLLGLFICCFAFQSPSHVLAQEFVDKFIVGHIASYTESALERRGERTAALTVITISSISSDTCDVRMIWYDSKGAVICTSATSVSIPLLKEGFVNHCSREATLASQIPVCSDFCRTEAGEPVEVSVEGFARIQVAPACADHIAVNATVYHTLFDPKNDNNEEVIFSTRSPRVYRIDGGQIR